ncbi:MAG TPA: helix-turn-helix transcriptional regulator [Gaiellaceae bacterium]|nr:helix-turn-helix transcriptional regulator [Gaiellaceae bacterium]
MSRRAGRPSLPDEDAERIRSELQRTRDEKFAGNATRLAKALGMSQSGVTQIINRRNRPSTETAVALAQLLGVEVWQLMYGKTSGAALTITLDTDIYPNRARAIAAARLLRRSEAAIARVQQRPGAKSDEDRPVDAWFHLIEVEEASIDEPRQFKGTVLNPSVAMLPPAPPRGRKR